VQGEEEGGGQEGGAGGPSWYNQTPNPVPTTSTVCPRVPNVAVVLSTSQTIQLIGIIVFVVLPICRACSGASLGPAAPPIPLCSFGRMPLGFLVPGVGYEAVLVPVLCSAGDRGDSIGIYGPPLTPLVTAVITGAREAAIHLSQG